MRAAGAPAVWAGLIRDQAKLMRAFSATGLMKNASEEGSKKVAVHILFTATLSRRQVKSTQSKSTSTLTSSFAS